MSEHVEVLRGIYREWARGNLKAGLDLLDPHVVYVNRPGLVEDATCYGREEMQHWMREFLSAWERYEAHATEFIPAGDSIVVRLRQVAAGRGSGIPIEAEIFHVWTFRGGVVIRLESVPNRNEALATVGLSG
ncbi:MAG: nuclear transport factor 2 family protein [Actinomycetota bacterium]|nr:nuclear transport factor 2 family protein [Actinomycetota bacterium]